MSKTDLVKNEAATVVLKNKLRPKLRRRMRKDLYEQMKTGLLRVIPRHEDGVRAMDLVERLKGNLSRALWAGSSIQSHATAVKLDLEARKLIERIPGSRPQRLRRLVTW